MSSSRSVAKAEAFTIMLRATSSLSNRSGSIWVVKTSSTKTYLCLAMLIRMHLLRLTPVGPSGIFKLGPTVNMKTCQLQSHKTSARPCPSISLICLNSPSRYPVKRTTCGQLSISTNVLSSQRLSSTSEKKLSSRGQ